MAVRKSQPSALSPCSVLPHSGMFVDSSAFTSSLHLHSLQKTALPRPATRHRMPTQPCATIKRTLPREDNHTGPENGLGATQAENVRVLVPGPDSVSKCPWPSGFLLPREDERKAQVGPLQLRDQDRGSICPDLRMRSTTSFFQLTV